MAHPEVPAEQAHLDRAYARLEELRALASASLRAALEERGGTFQSFTERDIRVRNSLSRLEQLQVGDQSLVFGRIDRRIRPSEATSIPSAPSASEQTTGRGSGSHLAGQSGGAIETFHIGRLGVSGPDQEPLVVDWRAPVAEPFYRSTGAQPMGLVRRRHFLTDRRRVLDLEDELFEDEFSDSRAQGETDEATLGRSIGLAGEGVLMSTLERSRTGRMRDIVSTVQREQDEVIRAPLAGLLVVVGGPGTGKTAVALHRAAFLLYTYRFPLESQGVLVVGPNPIFLRYIEHVLPSLGESGVVQSTVTGLYSQTRPSRKEPPRLAALKADPRMARVIANAVATRQRGLAKDASIPYGSVTLRLSPEDSARLVAAARRRPGTHNSRRRLVESLLWQHLVPQVEAAQNRWRNPRDESGTEAPSRGTDSLGGAADIDALSPAELGQQLRRVPEVAAALDRMWPVLSAEELLHDLFGAAALMSAAARGVLSAEERLMLLRPRSDRASSVRWSDSDVPLLDEARALLGPPTRKRPPEAAEPRSFGHIVVDEAQDLTPMQLRMIGRRSLSGSMTVVGDLAQATGGWAPSGWEQVVEHLPAARHWSQSELTVNYRTPSEIMDLAAAVLQAVEPSAKPPTSVRSTGELPRFERVAREALGSMVAACLRAFSGGQEAPGNAAVIVAPCLFDLLAEELVKERLLEAADGAALDSPLSLLVIDDAKGLEFDTVVVVEPTDIARESPRGERALYVALTRSTRHLAVVYSKDLPSSLSSGAAASGGPWDGPATPTQRTPERFENRRAGEKHQEGDQWHRVAHCRSPSETAHPS